jgi:hypothetical protein
LGVPRSTIQALVHFLHSHSDITHAKLLLLFFCTLAASILAGIKQDVKVVLSTRGIDWKLVFGNHQQPSLMM